MSHTLLMPEGRYEASPNLVIFGVKFTNRQATVAALTPVQADLFPLLGFTIDGVLPPIPPTAYFTPAQLDAIDQRAASALGGITAGAPSLLNTFVELADAIGDDPHFAAAVTAALQGKATPAQIAAAIDTKATSDRVTYVPKVTSPDDAAAKIAALAPGTPYTFIQSSPFDIYSGVA